MDTKTQPTIWEVPDDVWTIIEPILNECYPAKPKGHRRVDLRPVLNGIIFRLRTGCQRKNGREYKRAPPSAQCKTVLSTGQGGRPVVLDFHA